MTATDKKLYTNKVMEHFLRPRNIGIIKNATNIGIAGNPADGDVVKLYLTIKGNIITDAKAQVFGCAVAIASTSILTEMIKGKTIEEALRIKNEDIANALGGLPKQKLNCSVLAEKVLKNAIYGNSANDKSEKEK